MWTANLIAIVRVFGLKIRLQLYASLDCKFDCNCPRVWTSNSIAIVGEFGLQIRLYLSVSLDYKFDCNFREFGL